jgi:hypothetical protein
MGPLMATDPPRHSLLQGNEKHVNVVRTLFFWDDMLGIKLLRNVGAHFNEQCCVTL